MNIGQIPPDKGRVDATSSSRNQETSAKRAARLAKADHAVISGPAREQQREISRLLADLDSIETGKSESELAKLQDRLDRGGFDHDGALRDAAEKFLASE